MIQPEQIKSVIEDGLQCDHVEVAGDGHHFEAVIVSSQFRGKS
ncbi:MAG: BolA family transcriptional regulator, partial [Betaproteobacteria bacterium]|nr:BolA family transcriptional regulator [Betaproteobacteria bacterium]